MNRSVLTRAAIGATTLVAAAGIVGFTGATANADDPEPPAEITAQYDASGTSHIQNKNASFNVPLGPTKLTADVSAEPEGVNGIHFVAALPLPPKTVKFKAFGYLPVQAKVYFTQVGPATGDIIFDENGGTQSSDASAKYVITLRDVIVGYSKANVGDNCQTRYPINVNVSGGTTFDLSGGTLSGTYDLGKFNNCGSSTDLANLIVPSTNNTISLKLSNLQVLDLGSTPSAKQAKAQIAKVKATK